MNQAVGPYVNFSRHLGAAALAGFEELLSFQFDHAQALATRSGKHLRTVLSAAGSVCEPEQLPESTRQWIGYTHSLLREFVVSGIDYQIEVLRLMQKRATETREVIAESEQGPIAVFGENPGRSRRGGKNTGFEQKLAA